MFCWDIWFALRLVLWLRSGLFSICFSRRSAGIFGLLSGWFYGCAQVGFLVVSLDVLLGSVVCPPWWFFGCVQVGSLLVSLDLLLGSLVGCMVVLMLVFCLLL
jgi:hypothetical protein